MFIASTFNYNDFSIIYNDFCIKVESLITYYRELLPDDNYRELH